MWTRMHGSWNHLGRAWQHHLALHRRVFFPGHSSPSQMLELRAPTAALRGLAGTAALPGDDSSRAMEAAEQAWGFPNFKISSCEDGTDTAYFTFLVGSFSHALYRQIACRRTQTLIGTTCSCKASQILLKAGSSFWPVLKGSFFRRASFITSQIASANLAASLFEALDASRVVFSEGEAVSLGLTSKRTWTWSFYSE